MVIKANKVQYAMDNNPMQFALITTSKGLGILLNTVYADAEFTRKYRLAVRQWKGHNVGVKIVA